MKIHKILMKKCDDKCFKNMIDESEFVNFICARKSNNMKDIKLFKDVEFFRYSEYFQNGGSSKKNSKPEKNLKKIKYEYDGKEFILYEMRIDEGYDISIYRNDDPNDPQSCLHISTDTSCGIAYVRNIEYSKNCVSAGLEYPGGGSILLKLCIKFLKENRTKYGIRRIQLKDNSTFTCIANKKKIALPVLHTLLFGDTWYGKYGFRPYDYNNDTEDDRLAKAYDNNKIIITTTKAKDTNIFNYFLEMLNSEHPEKKEENEKKIKEQYKKYGNLTLDRFFRKFIMNFQKTCVGISMFYMNFSTNLKLQNFYGESFYLDI
jgi:hypothetical protein